MALRISRPARQRFEIGTHVSPDGLPVGAWETFQWLAVRLNERRSAEPSVSAAELHALTVLDAAFRQILQAWAPSHRQAYETTFQTALGDSYAEFAAQWQVDFGGDVVIEPIIISVHEQNPAAEHLKDLIASSPKDAGLRKAAVAAIETAAKAAGTFRGTSILAFLKAAIQASTLDEQVRWVLENWRDLLDESLINALLRSQDYFREEAKIGLHGPGPTQSYDFLSYDADEERFTQDRDWMPNCVIIAKNIYVWLYQLSRKYGRQIDRLDHVPEEELAELSRRGLNGLWMIGLWERSDASRKIKQLCGNPDAVASAYSLYDYRIADALGGDDAWQELRDRAWRHGVRLAADMVPNHVGVVSKWVIEHPDWFVSTKHSPFPSYTFNGPDLCDDPNLSIHIEDHYFDKTDAAVVFKRYDHSTGDERYIYHGNDGTTMPWNDTAQLDYLNPEVREAVIQTILHVAKRFPIIRFDAAMTLVKQHVQRLWYPEPGSGGAIPSRASFGITKIGFDRRMPREFWQEVVDRVAEEAPDTLLLAEAFWMLEGYFVRNLGMHRVYNSAFMNMLRDEENAKYRGLMRDTMAADPQILKRYVNFMNNPDEDTAVEQFGSGDKYFGVCVLMATMPGLPMFGHGQVEGFREKYGMDFRKPMHDEDVDQPLLEHHERVIFPLLHRRWLFSEVEDFVMYDLQHEHGTDENVFVYSNRSGDERALVAYHNRFGDAAGWVKNSPQMPLMAGLGFEPGKLVRFKEVTGGLEYLRWTDELQNDGIFLMLGAYEYRVFLDWKLADASKFGELCNLLGGHGVEDLELARQMLEYQPLHEAIEGFALGKLPWKKLHDELRSHADLSFVEPKAELPKTMKYAVVHLLKAIHPLHASEWFDVWRFPERLGLDPVDAALARAALAVEEIDAASWLNNVMVQRALKVNIYNGRRWYRAEAFDAFVSNFGKWLAAPPAQVKKHIKLLQESADGTYDFDELVEMVAGR